MTTITKQNFLDPSDVRTLIRHLKRLPDRRRLYTLAMLIRYTGLRISEALGLNLGQVFDGFEIRRECTLLSLKKRGKKEGRTVSLCSKDDVLRTALRAWVKSFGRNPEPDLPLFQTRTGARWERCNASHELEQARLEAGIPPFGWHQLRHCYGSELYDLTGDEQLVRSTLGHKSVETTLRYIHIPMDKLHEANVAIRP